MDAQTRRDRFEGLAPDLIEPLRRFLARRTDAATADDVLSETLLVCWRRLEELPDPPLPWAYAVARNCLANAERGARRQQRVAAKISVVDPPHDTVPGPGEGSGADDALAEAMATLRAEDAELLRLWAWEQLAPAEIAVVLGITANAASIRLHRARAKLRQKLGHQLGEESRGQSRKAGDVAGHEESTGRREP